MPGNNKPSPPAAPAIPPNHQRPDALPPVGPSPAGPGQPWYTPRAPSRGDGEPFRGPLDPIKGPPMQPNTPGMPKVNPGDAWGPRK